ncbi:hypothetical protein KOW79_006455 [Hemibagrus wyckioides]|uniref:Uncharacterized protein n=1 Tax=Hemibagrus wyckioides TaxID=337641 RepID=A0A9D3NWD6_9TELE|nr:transcriptional-regulating factor 1 [Hemibagrus wyckioides]XP_058249983.1 transcriptional-regulating factor 1 [Hemibagrus wyckioides]KAG7330233.1 hypothetical protein KOW79_006455 [Hemibagrus wyckioides]
MADHCSINTSESPPFSAMYRLQTQGQRSNYNLVQNSPVSRINQYEDSSLLNDPANNCANAGTSMNGVGEQINTAFWDMESLISSQPGAFNRTKAHSERYEEEWNSSSQQQDSMENYDNTGGNHQKLDSFSEAFYCRNFQRIANCVDQVGYNVDPNNSPNIPPLSSLSFPLVLSPPPTPLPQPSLSPPKRSLYPPVTQSLSQTQSQSPSEGSLRFFPPLSSTSSILPGSFAPTHWLPLSTDTSGNGDITQHLPQDPGPSSVFPEGMGIHLRDLSATEGDTDCSLETSPCSPLVQHPPPQSVPKTEREHCPVTSEHHMTWSQMMSSQQFCHSIHDLNNQGESLRVHEEAKPIAGVQRTPLLCLSSSQNNQPAVYTGIPFHSVLQIGTLRGDQEHMTRHYTPLPMLNPTRSGTGLYCNLLPSLNHQEQWSEETGHRALQRHVNIGPEFQAEIPDLLEQEEIELQSQEPLQEELLWKPWAELERNDNLLEQVENLLDLSTSTALPEGVANLELALHSLYLCQGNVLAALEMMFFSNSKPSRDYHYSGSDIWRLSEQKLFQKAFAMYGKDFSFIHKMVQSKGVSQCVEYYYHSKRLREKQRKLKEKEAQQQQQQQQQQQMAAETLTPTNQVMVMNSINVDRLIHTPALAPSFPCKQCGKMFYKIKSRNAHMKIHRQQQEDWRERIHPNNHLSLTHALQNQNRTLTNPNQLVTQGHSNQLLTQSLIQNLVQTQAQLAFIQSSKTQNPCFTTAISSANSSQSPQMASKAPALPLYRGPQQTWGAIHGSLESGLYYD